MQPVEENMLNMKSGTVSPGGLWTKSGMSILLYIQNRGKFQVRESMPQILPSY